MPRSTVNTTGSGSFDPDKLLEAWSPADAPSGNDLGGAIVKAFGLKSDDDYVYHATASVTLAQVQRAVEAAGRNGLHAWYKMEDGELLSPPPAEDIAAYTNLFSSTTSAVKALTAMAANAKKNSLRAKIAAYLQGQLLLPIEGSRLTLQKLKKPHKNPYLDFWTWSCFNLEWAGPTAETEKVKHSHHILPVFYHHFGCVCPSFDALSVIQQLAQHKVRDVKLQGSLGQQKGAHELPDTPSVLDIGSGNGYWTYLLRKLGLTVRAIDLGASVWRTMWIADTIVTDGIAYLKGHSGGYDSILLLVYPQAGGDFTSQVLRAYEGDTVVVAGTQNYNGFTGFIDKKIDDWFVTQATGWTKIAQLPLPSFAGKDDALFVFRRF